MSGVCPSGTRQSPVLKHSVALTSRPNDAALVREEIPLPTEGPKPLRRVVTGHDEEDRSLVIFDSHAENIRSGASAGHFSTLLWCTDGMPVPIPKGKDVEDMGGRTIGTCPPVNGTRFMVADVAPGITLDMHRTETIDYAIVLDGEIDMELDRGSAKLRRGDVLIQRGTNHRWINRGQEIC